MWSYGPCGHTYGPPRTASEGTVTRIGWMSVAPNWMSKYHSSRVVNGCTPRVMGCSGKASNAASKIGLQETPSRYAPPIQSVTSRVP
jgi:hypothetical protein